MHLLPIPQLKHNIGTRFVIYILLFSSFTAILSTGVQLFFEYRRDIDTIKSTADQIGKSHISTIVQALWAYDVPILEKQLQGIKNFPDVSYAGIRKDHSIIMETDPKTVDKNFLSYEFELVYEARGKKLRLGTMNVKMGLSAVYERLWERVLVILITQTLKTFFVSIFIFSLFYFLVGRHLNTMAGFAESINLKNLHNPLTLKRRRSKNSNTDELGVVESALNTMRENLVNEIQNVRISQEALKKSEERFKSLVTNIPGIVYRRKIAPVWKIVYISDLARDISGYSLRDFLSGSINFAQLTYREDASRVTETIDTHVAEGKPFEVEYRIIHKDGSIRDVMEKGTAIYNDAHEPLWLDGVILDITRLKEIQRQNEELQRSLMHAQKIESIGKLAGGIAHDFNNILSSIIGFTELALDEVQKKSPVHDSLQEVYAGGKRAKELVLQILAFARQSEGTQKPTQIDPIIKEVFQFIRSAIPATIEIHLNMTSDSLIMGNPTALHQVLMNLCTNAAHAMEDKGGILDVRTKDILIDQNFDNKGLGLKYGNYLKISVSDTGIGISPDIIESIFEPYFTTKELGKGTGMGLAMVQGIIENHGGKITVTSTLGEGTIFTIYLPVTQRRGTEKPYEPERLPAGEERILFVDDEVPIAKMGSQKLSRLGYSVTSKTSSTDALELFKSNPKDFDLVITDMTMPHMTGDQLAVKMMEIRPDIPIILCTGHSKKVSEKTVSEIGIKAFLYKPISKTDLATTVRKVLDKKQGK